jgi:hypothetical protein
MRWTFTRKWAVLDALDQGRMTPGEVRALGISDDELREWRAGVAAFGIAGLMATRRPRTRVRKPSPNRLAPRAASSVPGAC